MPSTSYRSNAQVGQYGSTLYRGLAEIAQVLPSVTGER